MLLSTIRTSIKNKLEALSGSGQPFAFVYDFHKIGVDGFPCASFEPSRVENVEFDNANNMLDYTFDVVIQQGVNELTLRGEAMDILVAAVESVVDSFNEDPTLSGVCLRSIVKDINFGEVVHDKGHILYVSISIGCEALSFNL